MILKPVHKTTTQQLTYFHHLLLHHANIANQGYELCNSSF